MSKSLKQDLYPHQKKGTKKTTANAVAFIGTPNVTEEVC
jgi:hypothetical protein